MMFFLKTRRNVLTKGCLLAGLIAVLMLVQAGFAAEPEGIKRPTYSPVFRQNEDWSALAGNEALKTDRFFDPIKYISLSDDGAFWMGFGGQLRFRLEGWNNYNFDSAFDDAYLLTRLRLHTDIRTGKYLRFFAEIKSSFSTDRDLPGGRRTLDVDELDLQQAFVDILIPAGESGNLILRPGRQMLQLGKQRLVSPLDWSNTMRTWQGIQGLFDWHDWKINGFWTQFVPVEKYSFNEADSDEPFAGIYGTGMPWAAGVGLDGYWLYRERKKIDEKRHTFGGRIFGTFAKASFDYDVEAAYQFGDSGDTDVQAFMIGSQLGYRFSETAFNPRLYVGFDFGSGDDDPNDDKNKTFDQIYPLGHAYLGYMDFFGRQNILSPNIGVTFNPAKKLTCEATGLFFWRAEEEDAVYSAGGSVFREGAPGTSLEVGQEIDILLKYAYNVHSVFLLGYSHFFPGTFIKQTGPDDAADFVYASVQFTF